MFSVGERFEHSHLVGAYPWDAINAKVFVDVGGSHGAAIVALAQHVKSIHCIVQDLPEVIAGGSSKIPAEVSDRITFMAHDLFSEQPIKGADVYFFRWILHDWPDKYCIKVLQCLIPALKPGARIIISEFNVPPPGAYLGPKRGEFGKAYLYILSSILVSDMGCHRNFDLIMLELFNSKEHDWASLFARADARFKLIGIRRPPKSKLSFIEVVWEGDETT